MCLRCKVDRKLWMILVLKADGEGRWNGMDNGRRSEVEFSRWLQTLKHLIKAT